MKLLSSSEREQFSPDERKCRDQQRFRLIGNCSRRSGAGGLKRRRITGRRRFCQDQRQSRQLSTPVSQNGRLASRIASAREMPMF
jgi:hypothetical protein